MNEDISETEYRNGRELIVLGMKRTGNHAIITWINHLFPDPVYFINNVRHFTDPFARNHEFRRHSSSNVVNLHKKSVPDDVFSTEVRNRRKEVLLLSYEDIPLSELDGRDLIPDKDRAIGCSARETRILLLRDHYNMMASRMKMYAKEGSAVTAQRMARDLALWKTYAREFAGETTHVSGSVLKISYNDWFQSKSYRQQIAADLGLPFSDKGLEILPPQGSSFDDKTMDGKTQSMKVMERWRSMMDNDIYAELVRDPEAVELGRRIFGMSPLQE